jgi:hypothetical protein
MAAPWFGRNARPAISPFFGWTGGMPSQPAGNALVTPVELFGRISGVIITTSSV